MRLFGAAEALRQAIDTPLPDSYVDEQEQILALARGSLGDAAFGAGVDQRGDVFARPGCRRGDSRVRSRQLTRP